MGTFLQLLNITDRYERKARLLPALIVALPLAIAVGSVVMNMVEWQRALGYGTLFGGVIGVGLSHFARIPGVWLETKLCKKWQGLPTHRWLRPADTTHSEKQKSLWRKAICTITGISLPTKPGNKSEADINILINDAVLQLRHRLRNTSMDSMVNTFNEDYGFARNFAGMRWLWLIFSLIGAGLSYGHLIAFIASVVFVLVSAVSIFTLPGYVRHCANRYAEALLTTAVTVADAIKNKKKNCEPVIKP